MTHWLGELFVALSLVVSSGAEAATTCTTWLATGFVTSAIFPTQREAAQYVLNHLANSYLYPSPDFTFTLTGCDGINICTYGWTINVNGNVITGTGRLSSTCIPQYVAPRILTLSGGNKVEPSNGSLRNTLPFIVTVINPNTNQPPTNPVAVHISLKVDDPKSGGHDHGDSTRPRGGIANVRTCASDSECWSDQTINGAVVFNFNAPEASGTYTITATCDGCTNNPQTARVDVKVSDLWPIPESVYYALTEDGSSRVIGDNGNHSGNHYLTSAASMSLWRLARGFYEYQVQNGVVIPTLLHLNDASLKWGGKFDARGTWTGYHYTHDRGNVIDIRANTAAGYIPEEYFVDFENMAAEIDADAQLHCSENRDPALDNCAGDENRHYHVILN